MRTGISPTSFSARALLRSLTMAKLIPNGRNLEPILDETDQLIRIFVSSMSTARKNQKDRE